MIGVVIALVAVVLFALAWWSSGRAGKQLRSGADHDAARGLGTAQGMTHHDPPGSGGASF